MLNPQDLNPISVRRAENEVKDHVELESQDDIKQTSFQIIADLRRTLEVLEKKIEGGGLDGVKRPNLTARRIGILEVLRNVVDKMTTNIKGGGPIDSPVPAADDGDRSSPTPHPDDIGYGYGATHQALDSVETDPSKLTEGYKVIKKNETVQDTFSTPPSQLPDSAVEPAVGDDQELVTAYYELANSLSDRIEEMYEDSKELDVQTSKNTPSIKILVRGYAKSPHSKAAKQQEDASGVSGALPPTDKEAGYDTYMKHSTANPQRFG
jgi:hypothetical protein